jgi:hypothetical protein
MGEENNIATFTTKITCAIIATSHGNLLRIGDIEYPIAIGTDPRLVPNIIYYDNPKQTLILRNMLFDFMLGENMLLIGNQGRIIKNY